MLGDDDEVVVVDAAHEAARSSPPWATARVRGDRVHARRTTTTSTPRADLVAATGAPVLLHPDDRMLWDVVHPRRRAGRRSRTASVITVAGVDLRVLHTPGHSPGGVCL